MTATVDARTTAPTAVAPVNAELVEYLVTWGVEHRTGAAEVIALGRHLRSVWQLLHWVGVEAPIAEGWLRAVVAAPDAETMMIVEGMLTDAADVLGAGRSEWLALGQAGPLALAAGLTPTEVRAGLHTGTLTTVGLQTLAGLRGWMFPLLP